MKFLLAFILGVMVLSIWELRGGPKWRTPVVVATCAAFAFVYTSLHLVT